MLAADFNDVKLYVNYVELLKINSDVFKIFWILEVQGQI